MRATTSAWLEPLLDAATRRGIDTDALRRQATMPAAEAAGPAGDFLSAHLAAHPGPGLRSGCIDWIRFGQLLRDQLGWIDYPVVPVA